MFEKTREDLVDRLATLIDRYDLILERTESWQNKAAHAQRLGLNPHGPVPIIMEIQTKVIEQQGLCGESITLLLQDRALPHMFKGGVKRAEAFAAECETVLDGFDEAWSAGRSAFNERMKN
ncbi:MAG: hypothetical protein RIB52_02185 [Erythrobacter sp.]|uniref:hypothetical protein n=1 Tax=Erythrobacter sp. TaxID=1042 RepID=UPI0032EF85D9